MRALSMAMVLVMVLIGTTTVMAQTTVYTTQDGYIAATSEDLLDKAISYLGAKDTVALQKLMDTQMVFVLKAGMKVYITERGIFSGKIKIRPVGETFEVWTFREAAK